MAQQPLRVTAVADGLVNGERRSIPLKLMLLSGGRIRGWHSRRHGWHDGPVSPFRFSGAVVGRASWGQEHHALVVLGGEGIDRARTQLRTEPFSPAEITAALSR